MAAAIGFVAVAAAATAVVSYAGRSGGRATSPAATLPACVGGGARTTLPPGWKVPFPKGTAVSIVEGGAVRQVIGFAPYSFASAVAYFREGFPKRGYAIGNGDAENDEAEANFSGHGVRGRWRVNAIAGCPGATVVTIAVA
jgi:hypothetical protein